MTELSNFLAYLDTLPVWFLEAIILLFMLLGFVVVTVFFTEEEEQK